MSGFFDADLVQYYYCLGGYLRQKYKMTSTVYLYKVKQT